VGGKAAVGDSVVNCNVVSETKAVHVRDMLVSVWLTF